MLKRFLAPIKDLKKEIVLISFFGASFALIQLATIEAFRYVTRFLEGGLYELFTYTIIALVIIETVSLAQHRWFKQNDRRIVFEFLKKVYAYGLKQFLTLDHNYADKLGIGRLQAIFLKGIDVWMWFLYHFFIEGSRVFVGIIGALIILFITHVWIGVGAIIVLIIILRVFWVRNKGDRIYRKQVKEQYVDINRLSVMQMMSKFEILQADRTNHEIQKYTNLIDNLADTQLQKARYNFLAYHSIFSFFSFMQIGAYFIAGYLTFQGIVTLADFFVITLSFRLLTSMLKDVKAQLRSFSRDIVHIEKLRNIIDNGPKLQGVFEGDEFSPQDSGIVCKNMSFGYEEDSLVFDKLNLTLTGGKKTALVGISGSGKTTLIKLIAGYLRPTAGDITVDGQNLKDISLKSYYQHVGYLTQEPMVFDGTIWDNLTYAFDLSKDNNELTQRVDEAIHMAKCEFIYGFKKGLHTEIGERGIRLSGGQRQRLAIAKVFLKNPSLILLDEPTSALDSFSEEAITEAMHNLFSGRTVIIIAHRLQTVKEADDIIVFDEGTIIERGTHQELIDQGGSYAKMLELQSGF